MSSGGFNLIVGAHDVSGAYEKLTRAKDNHALGLGSQNSVERAEGDVQGAWGALVVDVVSGGLTGKVLSKARGSELMKGLKVSAISGAAGGVTQAAHPAVWDAPNTVALLMRGVVLGAALGATGTVAAKGIHSGVRMILARGTGKTGLVAGKQVRIQTDGFGGVIEARVQHVDAAKGVVTVVPGDGPSFRVRIAETLKLERNPLSPFMLRNALRPAKPSDFHHLDNGTRRDASRAVWLAGRKERSR